LSADERSQNVGYYTVRVKNPFQSLTQIGVLEEESSAGKEESGKKKKEGRKERKREKEKEKERERFQHLRQREAKTSSKCAVLISFRLVRVYAGSEAERRERWKRKIRDSRESEPRPGFQPH